jgi:hypothetical protein
MWHFGWMEDLKKLQKLQTINSLEHKLESK